MNHLLSQDWKCELRYWVDKSLRDIRIWKSNLGLVSASLRTSSSALVSCPSDDMPGHSKLGAKPLILPIRLGSSSDASCIMPKVCSDSIFSKVFFWRSSA
jgi:hypothetical protein